jgi:hypothetical protein
VFLSLDQKSKGPSGEMIRIRGLEWLRLESLRRAVLTPQEKEAYSEDLQYIRSRQHDCLIDLRLKSVIWVYPYPLPPLKRARAIEYVPPNSHWRHPERDYVSYNWTLSDKVLVAAFKKRIRESKAAHRAAGAGRRYSLARLYEALELHDARNAHNLPGKAVGFQIRTQKPLADIPRSIRIASERGRKVLALASLMINTAKESPGLWVETFF